MTDQSSRFPAINHRLPVLHDKPPNLRTYCPFCGDTRPPIVLEEGGTFSCVCIFCKARGPRCSTHNLANVCWSYPPSDWPMSEDQKRVHARVAKP